jgi:hypothetical protein
MMPLASMLIGHEVNVAAVLDGDEPGRREGKITESDQHSGSISAVSPDSQFSSRPDSGFLEETGLIIAGLMGLLSKFRERISIAVDADGRVRALSVSEPRTMILDQGRNRQHVQKFFDALDAILDPGAAGTEAVNGNRITMTRHAASVPEPDSRRS